MTEKMQFLKLPQKVITDGTWALLSSSARALYPVLLRFSDGNYGSVYPGTERLLKLTGFKQKSSIRKAREELRSRGLIDYVPGSGRTNTRYYFIAPGHSATPLGATRTPLSRSSANTPPGATETPEYKQIHISINQNVQTKDVKESRVGNLDTRLVSRFGKENLEKATHECELSNLPITTSNLEKILYQSSEPQKWDAFSRYLASMVTQGSYELIKRAFLQEEAGVLFFSDDIPIHLKDLLKNTITNSQIVFEPATRSKTLVAQGRL